MDVGSQGPRGTIRSIKNIMSSVPLGEGKQIHVNLNSCKILQLYFNELSRTRPMLHTKFDSNTTTQEKVKLIKMLNVILLHVVKKIELSC